MGAMGCLQPVPVCRCRAGRHRFEDEPVAPETRPPAEPCEGGVLIRPALVLPVEVYTPERKAQFLLSNAVDAADYADALAEVRAMGLDPETIPHYKPPGVWRVDRVFLDANVLLSAAWRSGAALQRLWRLEGVELLSSGHAVEEARRNLETAAQRGRLTRLLQERPPCLLRVAADREVSRRFFRTEPQTPSLAGSRRSTSRVDRGRRPGPARNGGPW